MCTNTSKTKSVRLFPLGQVVATPGALEALDRAAINAGDWGNVPLSDAEENMSSVENGWRILSSYAISDDQNLWIITEADRSVTTLLLPEEY